MHLLAPIFKVRTFPAHLTGISDRVIIHELGAVAYFHAFPPVLTMVKVLAAVFALCRKNDYDLVIAKGPREIGMSGVFGAKLAKVPVIYHHSLDWFQFPPVKNRGLTGILLNFYQNVIILYRYFFTLCVIKNADKIATPSHDSRFFLSKKFKVNLTDIALMTNTFTTNDNFFEVPPICSTGEKNILFVGRVDKNKNLYLLIRAMSLLKANGICCKTLVVVGDGPELENCKDFARDLQIFDYIKFVGYVPNMDVCLYLSRSMVLVLPSFSEVFPQVIIEAMAASRPVIGSNVGGIKELIEHGVNGFLINPDDEKDLFLRLKQIIENPQLACKMGELGRQKARQYDPGITADKWLDVAREILTI